MAADSLKNPATALTLALLMTLPVVLPSYQSIISFGDSLADTGNLLRLRGSDGSSLPCSRSPYGETFFRRPTGRYSNGRLVIDFIAESLGLPLVKLYVGGGNSGKSFEKGVNFAVAGATALDHEYLEAMGIYNPDTNASLGVQMDWFKQFLASLPDDGKRFVENSVVLLGEIGGNDYNIPLGLGMSPQIIRALAPLVVEYIGTTLQELIKLGAVTILVPGNFPIGCFPAFLTMSTSDHENYYDPATGCINWLNELSRYHNELLQKELNRIQKLYPDISIMYVDYYNALLKIFLSPQEFGFGKRMLSACCGGGGLYNYNKSAFCGFPSSANCEDPSLFISWDGLHLTEAAYRFLAKGLLEGVDSVLQSQQSLLHPNPELLDFTHIEKK